VKEVRSLSRFGLSQTVVIFHDDTNIYWASASRSLRKSSKHRPAVPAGVVLEMAPITTGLGEVFMYAVVPKPGFGACEETRNRTARLSAHDSALRDQALTSNQILPVSLKSIHSAVMSGRYISRVIPLRWKNYGITFNHISETPQESWRQLWWRLHREEQAAIYSEHICWPESRAGSKNYHFA
jgi:Cu/Ag efflux pump CusA